MNDNQNSYYQNKKSINQNYWKLSTKTELETHFELFFSQRFNFPSALVSILIDNKFLLVSDTLNKSLLFML